MPALISQPSRITGTVALVLSVLAILLAVSVNSTQCASASSGSCPVGDSETFAAGIAINTDLTTDDTVISGDTAASLFFADSSTDRIGIGLSTPTELLDVAGNVAITNTGTLTAANGGSLTGTWVDLGSVTTVDINGGTINGITDLAVEDGGTGVGTFTDGGVLIGNGIGNLAVTSAGTAAQVLTSNGPGVDPTFQAATAGGIDNWDQWRLTTSYSNSGSEQFITANLERSDTNGFAVLGSGMTETAGLFTFPEEGYWAVDYQATMSYNFGAAVPGYVRLYYTDDNDATSSVANLIDLYVPGNGFETSGFTSARFYITDTANQKVKFSTQTSGSGSVFGNTDHNTTYFNFTRIAE